MSASASFDSLTLSYRPVIVVQNQTVNVRQCIAASTLISSVSDPNGTAITYYDFRDDGGDGGYLNLNGVIEPDRVWITVSAANLSHLTYVGGSSAGHETVDVAAWDGTNWSYYQTATVTTKAIGLPVIVVQNQAVDTNASIAAGSLIASVSDPNGYAIASYEFRDDGAGGGHFALNGVQQASGTWITVAAASLSQLAYVGGASAGSEAVDVAAWDGTSWSYYQTATITTKAVLPAIVTVADATVGTGGTLAAATLITSVFDPNNYAITSYQFRDDGAGGGYFTLGGVQQAAGSWITVAPAGLSQLQYVGGPAAGSEAVEVEAWNGHVWSAAATATVITKAANGNSAPVLVAANQSVIANQSIAAATLIASVSDPNHLTPTAYEFLDLGQDPGYFILNGVRQASGSWITVSAANLGQLLYVGAPTPGTDTVDLAVWDGLSWSNTAVATVTTQAAPTQRPVLVAQNETVTAGGSIQAASLIASVTDPNGLAITYYEFRDDGAGGGHLALAGVQQAANTWITVGAGQLSQLTYVGGAYAGSEPVDVAAWDGYNWSYYQTATVTTRAGSPVLTLQNQAVAIGGTLPASQLIASASEPGGTITAYQFRDDGGDGGYFTLNGVKQATGTWISVSAAALPGLLYVGAPAAGSEQIEAMAGDGTLWSADVIATVTTQAGTPANPVLALLGNANIKADATTWIVNNQLSYTGMLTILENVAARGAVTQQELADLKTIVAHFNTSNGIKVSSYLAYIANAVVNGDPANAYWTGGTTSPVSLGNLAVGSSATKLNELIGKWFLGTDLPEPLFYGGVTGVYYADTNPIFGSAGLPDVNDINQGDLGDCYLLASLAEVAQDDPATIQSMFIDNGNDTWGVRFYINAQPVYVTVNDYLPVYAGTTTLCGNSATDIWGCLVEKAYVELNAEPNFLEHPTGNNYLLIQGGWADPITQVTGKSVTSYDSSRYSAAAWNALRTSIATAIESGEEVDFASFGNTTIAGKIAFDSQHMYSGIGYDNATGEFILRNPWGTAAGQTWLTEFEATMSDLYKVDGVLFVAQGVATPRTDAAAANTTVATVTASPSTANLGVGAVVTITLGLSGSVTVAAGTPTLLLNDGGLATYTGGSGTASLTFSYTVATGQRTGHLAVTGTALNGATILDGGGNAADLTGALAGLPGALRINETQVADFSSSGSSDILFRDPTSGTLGQFSMQNGQPTWSAIGWAAPSLQVAGIGDCNGDGTSDILFRDPTSGSLGMFAMHNGQPTWAAIGWARPDLQVVGVGDFNGDGTSDILFRDPTGGGLGAFLMHNGQPSWTAIGWASPGLQVVGIGDFNGDGTSDILFRDPTGGGLGMFAMHDGQPTWSSAGWAAPALQVVGIGDFNGDGTDDVLFRDPTSGRLSDFLMHNGQPTWAAIGWASPSLQVVGIGDYNANGTSDILFRDPSGGGISMFAMQNNQPTWASVGWAATALRVSS